MSWLNNSLNTIKGQLTNLAQEVLAETAGPGDEDYRGPSVDNRTALELLSDTQKEKEELNKLCGDKDNEIAILRKEITELRNKISDSGGGNTAHATATAASVASGRTSKSPSDNNTPLEDSWCWETDENKNDNDRSSETSSGNGNEIVNITLEEVPLGATSKSTKLTPGATSALQRRVQQLEEENKHLNTALDELDTQHNVAMQNVIELKMGLQEKLAVVTKDYEALKKEQADRFINSELEMARVRKQLEELEKQHATSETEKKTLQKQIDEYAMELKRATEEVADLQSLLEKRNQDNLELIERAKTASQAADRAEEERVELQQKIEQMLKDKDAKLKKSSECSASSSGKQSEDEFIVVREGDANSSGPTIPPTKEELKDKIVQLENRVSELTHENSSLALKLQDCEMEKELSANVLKENLQILQSKCEEQETQLQLSHEQLQDQLDRVEELKEEAGRSYEAFVTAEEKLHMLKEDKSKIEIEIVKLKDDCKRIVELEKRLIFCEQEKESLQLELQDLRTTKERVLELENKMQEQQLNLNAATETETCSSTNEELENKLKKLSLENETLRAELDSITHAKFREAIAAERTEITDLDADDEEAVKFEDLLALFDECMKRDLGDDADEAKMKGFKLLREKLMKVHDLEKNFTQLSMEVLELQTRKLAWDHEKKTLEADISQYIIQCDELMKNNEILLNELENLKRNKLETIHENNEENVLQLESQLEDSTKLIRTLEEEYAEQNEKIEELEKENQTLTEKLRGIQVENEGLLARDRFMKQDLETLELEKCNLLFELNELKSIEQQKPETDEAVRKAEEKFESAENQLSRLSKDHADLVAAMQAQKVALMEALSKREETEKALNAEKMLMASREDEIKVLKEELKQRNAKIDDFIEQHAQLSQELESKRILVETLKEELKAMGKKAKDMDELSQANDIIKQKFFEKECLIAKLQDDLKEKQDQTTALELKLEELETITSENADLQAEHDNLWKLHLEQSMQLEEFKKVAENESDSMKDTDAITRIAQLEAELLGKSDLQRTVNALYFEKNEMMKALQQKHSENMQYYMEINRLQSLVQPLQQQLSALESKACVKCNELEATIAQHLKERDKLLDQITFLKEKSDILTTNLLTEQTNQRLLQQEKAELEEQNAAVRKDLERLREHLLEVEDLHTQETVDMHRELEETKAKMIALQEEVSKSSNAYTSASIRANQHVETLQSQYALVVQQRDDLVAKLSLAEDRESKNQAALCNLQCALEQFQNDKENDISAATQRIRKELQQEMDKETQLQNEIATLNQQLSEANQGLRAAARLSDQLEACQQTIAALREEVETLKQQNIALEQQLSSSESSQTDKIDKNLIKSLLIGYVVSGHPNDKTQVLRMISTLLDFTQGESDKVGLNKQQSSWLGSILGGGGQAGAGDTSHSRENLVQAFVQFLEKESQPKDDSDSMPNLLNISQSTAGSTGTANAPSRRTSTTGNAGTAGAAATPIQPLTLNSNVLSDFAPTRNSSSILKDILNDT